MTDYVKLDLKILIASKLYPYSYDVNSVVTDLNIDNSQDFFRVFVVISESIEVVVNFITVSSKISYLDLWHKIFSMETFVKIIEGLKNHQVFDISAVCMVGFRFTSSEIKMDFLINKIVFREIGTISKVVEANLADLENLVSIKVLVGAVVVGEN